MDRYNSEATCIKCGGKDISSTFYKADTAIWEGGNYKEYKHEVIHRHCRTCNYFWDERPMDAEMRRP